MSICVLSERHFKSVSEQMINMKDSYLLNLISPNDEKKSPRDLVENYVDTLAQLNIASYEAKYEEGVGRMNSWREAKPVKLNKTGLLVALDCIDYQIEEHYLPGLDSYESFVLEMLPKILEYLSRSIKRHGKRYNACQWFIE